MMENGLHIFFSKLCLLHFAVILTSCNPSENNSSDYNDQQDITSRDYRQLFRPQYHFSPVRNFMNDPNGLFFHEGKYHLFFQHNPEGNKWGHMSWGHAVSPDLVNWKELDVALKEEDNIMIFSGSAVVDKNNTSGFDNDDSGEEVLVAIYTAQSETEQSQALAFSNDGTSWIKYENNPVLDLDMKDFRDPKVFWYDPDQKWVMVVALPHERKVHFYESENLKNWKLLSEFGPIAMENVIWECPDLYPLKVLETGDQKWVLHLSLGGEGVENSPRMIYTIGSFDGKTFQPDEQNSWFWLDQGHDFYAAVTWNHAPVDANRQVAIGWANNWKYANDIPTDPWRGSMSVPRDFMLKKFTEGIRLIQLPNENLRRLRTDEYSFENLQVRDVLPVPDSNATGNQFELFVEFSGFSSEDFGLEVLAGENEKTRIGYDAHRKYVYLDRSGSGKTDFSPGFEPVMETPLEPENGKVRLHVFVDHSIVEVFANDGRVVLTARIFPDPESTGINLYSSAPVKADRLRIWKMRSIYERQKAIPKATADSHF